MLKNENKTLKNENENLKRKMNDLIIIKDEEIRKLIEKFKILSEEKMKNNNRLNSNLNNISTEPKDYNELPDEEKLIAINFISVDQEINYSITCTNKTSFYEVEKKLYTKYPQYEENENFFMFNGSKINKWETIEENGMNGYIVILKTIDDE